MKTPAVLLFLHMLGAAGALHLASRFDAVGRLSAWTSSAAVKGASVACALWAAQMLCAFSALHHNSVLFVLTWSSVVREAIQAGVAAWTRGQPLSGDTRLVLGTAAGAAGGWVVWVWVDISGYSCFFAVCGTAPQRAVCRGVLSVAWG
jgi:hypothetical protein